MIISISGAQCTGKTTLVNALKHEKIFENAIFIGSPSRKANDKGIKINDKADHLSQLWIVSSYMKELIEAIQEKPEHIISDRCLIDMLVYTTYNWLHCKGDSLEKFKWNQIYSNICDSLYLFDDLYDYNIILHPEFDLIDDGVRSIDKAFQQCINNYFIDLETSLRMKNMSKVINISGSVEERVNRIVSLVK